MNKRLVFKALLLPLLVSLQAVASGEATKAVAKESSGKLAWVTSKVVGVLSGCLHGVKYVAGKVGGAVVYTAEKVPFPRETVKSTWNFATCTTPRKVASGTTAVVVAGALLYKVYRSLPAKK